MTTSSNLELEQLGILHHTKLPSGYSWMTEPDKQLCLALGLAGPGGLSVAQLRKEQRRAPDASLRLYAYSLAEWETDKVGRPTHFALTSKGETVYELLVEMARHQRGPTAPC